MTITTLLLKGEFIGQGPKFDVTIKTLKSTSISYIQGNIPDKVTGSLGKGIGRITGVIKDKSGNFLRRKVRLIRDIDGLKLRETWSDAETGAYSFEYIDELRKWTVITVDYENRYNAEIQDNITPELMK